MTPSPDLETLKFYNQEAEEYCARTGSIPSPGLPQFLACLRPGASILELGCGSGRDTVEMLRQGYRVTPTDGSPEMVRQAERRLKRPVAVLEFGEIDGEARFDGVWASACLLHAPVAYLGDIISRIHRVLNSPGILFANFKEGAAEGRDGFGRYYNYPSSAMLRETFQQAAPWASLKIERSSGQGYDGAPVVWLNCTAVKC
jgi:SAM-dependent methyltransferase